jgi:hypothetical protein
MWRVGTFCFARWLKGAAELSAYENFSGVYPTKVNLLSCSNKRFQPLLGNRQKRQ